jgi:opacity protein-like surface antigen
MKGTFQAVGLVLALPLASWAQTSETTAAPTKDKEAVTYNEIERGVNLGVEGGPFFLIQAPKSGPFSTGEAGRVEAGFDFGERVSVELFVMGTTNHADSSYQGCSKNPSPCSTPSTSPATGDYSSLIPGASARVNIVGIADAQDNKRLWLYAKGGAGYVLFQPSSLLNYSDIFLFGGLGLDYFTHLRHFSIGIEADFSYFVTSSSPGIAVLPNVRYAF